MLRKSTWSTHITSGRVQITSLIADWSRVLDLSYRVGTRTVWSFHCRHHGAAEFLQFVCCPVAGFAFIGALVLCTEMQRIMLGVLYAELVGGVPSGLSLYSQRLTLSCASYAADG